MSKLLLSLLLISSTHLYSDTNTEITKRLQTINEGDVEAFSTLLTNDADFTQPVSGEIIQGKSKIVDWLTKMKAELTEKNAKFNFKLDNIDVTGGDKAVAKGVVTITAKGATVRQTARKIILVKQNNDWFISSIREIDVAPAPDNHQFLSEIGWLVGNWQDKDDNVTITFTTSWDKFQNFIKQNFKMDVYGFEAMEGLQIIGWDPLEKKLRSWIYDSDGGFGTGLWTKEGDSWHVHIDYVLSDGSKATATNIYKKLTDSSYSFSSIERSVNGEAIPELEPVIVTKGES